MTKRSMTTDSGKRRANTSQRTAITARPPSTHPPLRLAQARPAAHRGLGQCLRGMRGRGRDADDDVLDLPGRLDGHALWGPAAEGHAPDAAADAGGWRVVSMGR